MYGLLNGYAWAINGYKIALAVYALQNFVSYLNPVRGVKVYARNKPLSPLVVSSLRTTANNGLVFCIQTAALLSGVDTLTSIGYAWGFASTLLLLELCFGNDLEELKLDRSPFYGWLALSFVVVGTLLL